MNTVVNGAAHPYKKLTLSIKRYTFTKIVVAYEAMAPWQLLDKNAKKVAIKIGVTATVE